MAPNKPRQTSPFDPQALLDAQRRNFAAFTNAGEIVVDGMRAYAERQAAMVQETMSGLWGELQAGAAKPGRATPAPAEQMERARAAFEKVVSQVHELTSLLIKVQSEALSVLNACARRNFETLGSAAPDFSDLQSRAQAAFETANRETVAVVDEMKRRMAGFEAGARAASPPAPSMPPPAASPSPPPRAASGEASSPSGGSTSQPKTSGRSGTKAARARPAAEKPSEPEGAKADAPPAARKTRKAPARAPDAAARTRRGGGPAKPA